MGTCLPVVGFKKGYDYAVISQNMCAKALAVARKEPDLEALSRRFSNTIKALLRRRVQNVKAAQDIDAVSFVLRHRRPPFLFTRHEDRSRTEHIQFRISCDEEHILMYVASVSFSYILQARNIK